jgi:hypothetical protein
VRKQALALLRIRLILALSEDDMGADGVCERIERLGGLGSALAGVDSHVLEADTKAGLNETAHGLWQRGARRVQNVLNCFVRRVTGRTLLTHGLLSSARALALNRRDVDGDAAEVVATAGLNSCEG